MSRKVLITICVVVVAAAGIWMLTSYERAKKTQELLTKMSDPDDLVAMDALDQLVHHGSGVGPKALALMTSQDAQLRCRACTLVSALGYDPKPAQDQVIALLSDPNTDVQRAAAEACGHMNIAASEQPLLKLLQDPKSDPELLAIVAQSLGMIGSKAAVPVLAGVMKNHPPVEPKKPEITTGDNGTSATTASTTTTTATSTSTSTTASTSTTTTPAPPKDPTWELRMEAALALGQIGDPGGAEALQQSVHEDQEPKVDVRAAAAAALGELGSNSKASHTVGDDCLALVDAMGDSAGDVRIAAVMALSKLYPPSAVMPQVERAMKEHVNDDHYWVRRAVKYAAHKLGITLSPTGV